MGQTSFDKQSALKIALAFSTEYRSFHAFQRLTLLPSCTKIGGQFRETTLKSTANKHSQAAAAATKASVDLPL